MTTMGDGMKIEFIKQAGGVLVPASDIESERMARFKTSCQYTVEIKLTRNPAFHGKVFAFLGFCFAHWKGDREFLSEAKQFDVFREKLTIIAGYFDELYDLDGSVTLKAKSLAYANMEQEEFEQCYSALIGAAMTNIFPCADSSVENQLFSFF